MNNIHKFININSFLHSVLLQLVDLISFVWFIYNSDNLFQAAAILNIVMCRFEWYKRKRVRRRKIMYIIRVHV